MCDSVAGSWQHQANYLAHSAFFIAASFFSEPFYFEISMSTPDLK